MEKIKLLFIVGLSLLTGFIWGRALYIDSSSRLGQYDEMISVDVVRTGDDILIVDHRTGRLIFEYNRFKETDKEAFREYEDLLK